MANGARRTSVVPLSSVRMACHLVPCYHRMDPEQRISSSDDLLTTARHFFFNKYASHFLFALMEHWRRKSSKSSIFTSPKPLNLIITLCPRRHLDAQATGRALELVLGLTIHTPSILRYAYSTHDPLSVLTSALLVPFGTLLPPWPTCSQPFDHRVLSSDPDLPLHNVLCNGASLPRPLVTAAFLFPPLRLPLCPHTPVPSRILLCARVESHSAPR